MKKKIFATLSESEDRAALRLSQFEAREVTTAHPETVRLVSDREPFSWISVEIKDFDAQQFEDLLEEAWKLRAPDDLRAAYG